jgi:hypothetical protein
MTSIDSIQEEMKLETIKIISKPNLYLMKILDRSSIEQVIDNLNKYSEVEYSEPNFIYSYD